MHTGLSLRGLFPWWNERQQHQHELRLEEAVLPFTDPLALAKANSEHDFLGGDRNCDNQELNIRLITLRPEGSFLRICFDHLIYILSHRGL